MSLLLNLPEEVHDDIFLRVPAESILSSRCVCKLFYHLLSKPNFIKNHLNRTIETKNQNPKLLLNHFSRGNSHLIHSIPIDYASISIISPSLSYQGVGAVQINYPFEPTNIYCSFEFIGSCNGLVCSKVHCVYRSDKEWGKIVQTCHYSVLNPLTREYKDFKEPWSGYEQNWSDYEQTWSGYERCVYGFGYDSNIYDYKLVIISDYRIDLLTVKSGSWSSIQRTVNYSFPGGTRTQGVFLNGAVHWLGSITTQENSSEVIICFDISNETMVDMPLPDNITPPIDYQGRMDANVGVWGDCICIAYIWDSVRIDVWVMQGYGVRIKRFTSTERQWTKNLFWKPLWCYGSGEILIDNEEKLLLYDPRTERVTVVSVCDIAMDNNRETYVESIVSLGTGTCLRKRITDEIAKDLE